MILEPITQGIRELGLSKSALTNQLPLEELEPLSQIIQQLNQQFGTNFTEDERVFIRQVETKLDESEALKASIQVNSPENARLTFNNIINDMMQDLMNRRRTLVFSAPPHATFHSCEVQ